MANASNDTQVQTVSPAYISDSLPTAVVANPKSLVSLSDILKTSFGTDSPEAFSEYRLFTNNQNLPNGTTASSSGQIETSYWGIGEYAVDSVWQDQNGNNIASGTLVDPSDFDSVYLYVGNSMLSQANIQVLVKGSTSEVPVYRNYNIWTSQPAVQSASFGSGSIDPSDIVESTYNYSHNYPLTPNYNNCNWIADNVAASAGATMPYENFNNDPSENVSGGFWRVVYRGNESNPAVVNWSTLTQPGDIVRMVWDGQTSHHTTTVTGQVGPDGQLPIYDNAYHIPNTNGPGKISVIGHHTDVYWDDTVPQTITIYRLDPNHQYLISDYGYTQQLQGTANNDLFDLQSPNDTVTTGLGFDEISGSSYEINGLAITDWAGKDSISVSDISSYGATASYNPISGILTISGQANGSGSAAKGATVVMTVQLSSELTNGFFITADSNGPGLIVRSGDRTFENTDFADVMQRTSVSGNVLVGTEGSDVTEVSYLKTSDDIGSTPVSIDGAYGTLTIDQDGAYTYNASVEGSIPVGAIANDDFTLTITDSNGDTEAMLLQISVTGSAEGNAGANNFVLTGPGTLARGRDGNDAYVIDSRRDTVVEAYHEGRDSVYSSVSYTLPANVERIMLLGSDNLSATGNEHKNSLIGNSGDNDLYGRASRDLLRGNEGSDTFIYTKISDSTASKGWRDTIRDFSQTDDDRIDLHAIDASLKTSGNQAFDFIGTRAFTNHAGELRFENTKGGNTLLLGDVDGNGQADFAILLNGIIDLHKGDFLL